jgi:hypothetical protein
MGGRPRAASRTGPASTATSLSPGAGIASRARSRPGSCPSCSPRLLQPGSGRRPSTQGPLHHAHAHLDATLGARSARRGRAQTASFCRSSYLPLWEGYGRTARPTGATASTTTAFPLSARLWTPARYQARSYQSPRWRPAPTAANARPQDARHALSNA